MFLKPRVEQRVAEPVSFASGHPSLPSNSKASISFSLACSAAEVFRCTRFLMFASITARSKLVNVPRRTSGQRMKHFSKVEGILGGV